MLGWAQDKQIFCLRNGAIFKTNVKNVAVERDFHKLQLLGAQDIEFIRLLIGQAQNGMAQLHRELLDVFALLPQLRENLSPEIAQDNNLVAQLDHYILHAEEDFHSRIEFKMVPVLEAVRRSDISFYDDAYHCMKFLHFLSLQSLRTKGVQERIVATVTTLPGVDIRKCMPILRLMFAINAGRSLFLERKKRPLYLLENKTGIPFITGDQPVINLFHLPGRTDSPLLLGFYYPVTPWLALVLDEVDERCGYGPGPLSADQVRTLNREMQEAAFEQLFGDSREALESLGTL